MGLRVGLTGGVGSGKSTVAQLLVGYGAVVVDADAIAREVVAPSTDGFGAVVAHFGDRVIGPDGALDRAALAEIVFSDSAELDALNAIVHPMVGQRSAEVAAAAPPDAVVVYDIPLLVENGLADGFDAVVVVQAPEELRVHRLAGRGMSETDARARIAAQASDQQRAAVADVVIMNAGDRNALAAGVEQAWQRLTGVERHGRVG